MAKRISKAVIESCRREYLSGLCTSLSELAAKYNIKFKSLESIALRQRWKAQRNQPMVLPEQPVEGGLQVNEGSVEEWAREIRAKARTFVHGAAGLVEQLIDDASALRPLARQNLCDFSQLVSATSAVVACGRSLHALDTPTVNVTASNLAIRIGELESEAGLVTDMATAEPSPAYRPSPAPAAIPTKALSDALDV